VNKFKDTLRYRFKAHALKRLQERYGLTMNYKEWYEFKSKTSMAKFITKMPPDRVLRMLPFKGHQLFFVWDKTIGEIVTFLPPSDSRCQGVLEHALP
jgi:hypothetical protein